MDTVFASDKTFCTQEIVHIKNVILGVCWPQCRGDKTEVWRHTRSESHIALLRDKLLSQEKRVRAKQIDVIVASDKRRKNIGTRKYLKRYG